MEVCRWFHVSPKDFLPITNFFPMRAPPFAHDALWNGNPFAPPTLLFFSFFLMNFLLFLAPSSFYARMTQGKGVEYALTHYRRLSGMNVLRSRMEKHDLVLFFLLIFS